MLLESMGRFLVGLDDIAVCAWCACRLALDDSESSMQELLLHFFSERGTIVTKLFEPERVVTIIAVMIRY